MKLDEAIEILKDTLKPGAFVWTPDLPDAMNLGLEALKRFQEGRPKCFISTVLLLPGETKE